jgi:hypothetical protein
MFQTPSNDDSLLHFGAREGGAVTVPKMATGALQLPGPSGASPAVAVAEEQGAPPAPPRKPAAQLAGKRAREEGCEVAPLSSRSSRVRSSLALDLSRMGVGAGPGNAGGSLPTVWAEACSSSSCALSCTGASEVVDVTEAALSAQAQARGQADSNAVLAVLLAAQPAGYTTRSMSTGLALVPSGTAASGGPCARWGHAATLLDGWRMLVYGGQSGGCDALADSWILDLRTGRWSELSCANLPPRAWHGLVQVPGREWTVAYGAVHGGDGGAGAGAGAGGEVEAECEEVTIIDTEVGFAYPPALTGRLPSCRSGAALAIVPLVTMPGGSVDGKKGMRTPEAAIVVFGGQRKSSGRSGGRATWVNDVFAWPVGSSGAPKYSWAAVRHTEGRQPLPRCYSASVGVGSRLVVFGGNNGDDTFGDVAYLSCTPSPAAPDAWSWHWPVCSGGGPRPRTGASAVAIGDRFVLVTGGWDPEEEETTAAARKAAAAGSKGGRGRPPGLSASPAPPEGGRAEGDPFPEAWLLDMACASGSSSTAEEWEWIRLCPASGEGLGRTGHSAVLVEDVRGLLPPSAHSPSPFPLPGLVLFGGMRVGPGRSATHSNDIAVLTLPADLLQAGRARSAAVAQAAADWSRIASARAAEESEALVTTAGVAAGEGWAAWGMDEGDGGWSTRLGQPNPATQG